MTSVLTTTWTCDKRGIWREEPRILTKDANGWHDTPIEADANRRAATEQKERK